MMMFDDKVVGWGWLNDDVIKIYKEKNFVCANRKKGWNFLNFFLCGNFFMSVFFLYNRKGDSL